MRNREQRAVFTVQFRCFHDPRGVVQVGPTGRVEKETNFAMGGRYTASTFSGVIAASMSECTPVGLWICRECLGASHGARGGESIDTHTNKRTRGQQSGA